MAKESGGSIKIRTADMSNASIKQKAIQKEFLKNARKELENKDSGSSYESRVNEFKKNYALSKEQVKLYSDEAYRKYLQGKIEQMALQGYNKAEIMNSLINDEDLKKDTERFEKYTQFFAGWIDNKLSKVTPMRRIQQNDKNEGKDITE